MHWMAGFRPRNILIKWMAHSQWRRKSSGRIAPVLGIMLIRNENDILMEVLREHVRHCDHIFILDGATEDPETSRAICKSFPAVSYFLESELPALYSRPIRDGARQFLLDQARRAYGENRGWFVLLHGDEIFVDSPQDIISSYDPFADCLAVDSLLYFLHRDQKPFVWDDNKPLAEQIRWYAGPGWPEIRMFRNRTGVGYEPAQHSNLLPRGISSAFKTNFKLKHYPYRSPKSQAARATDRTQITGFSPGTYRHVLQGHFYLDHAFFHYPNTYAYISQKPPAPRIGSSFARTLVEDLIEGCRTGTVPG